MNGHTRFSALIGFEADGLRFAHTGDQYFFNGAWLETSALTLFSKYTRMLNHVYRNGALLDGYAESARWLLRFRPHIVLQGHQQPFITDEHFFKHVEQWGADYEQPHRAAMVLGEEELSADGQTYGQVAEALVTIGDERQPG